ncbi:MAG: Fic family protein, partial [Gemmatimonadetes bacterium]|nr:Fic family protein [Gemmatimonadota bacterium]
AALAHLDFVAVHPFPDGNGRIARLLMNLCLVTAGLPWVTIRTDDRLRYVKALEAATVGDDARPFARFVLDYVLQAVDSV